MVLDSRCELGWLGLISAKSRESLQALCGLQVIRLVDHMKTIAIAIEESHMSVLTLFNLINSWLCLFFLDNPGRMCQ